MKPAEGQQAPSTHFYQAIKHCIPEGNILLMVGAGVLLVSTAILFNLRPAPPAVQRVPCAVSHGVSLPETRTDHSPSAGADVNNEWSFIFTFSGRNFSSQCHLASMFSYVTGKTVP
jgi:hypothetical protein